MFNSLIIFALTLTLFTGCSPKEVKNEPVGDQKPAVEVETEVPTSEPTTTNEEKGEKDEKENIAILENDPTCPEGWKRFVDYLHKYKVCFPKDWIRDISTNTFYTGQYPYDNPMSVYTEKDHDFSVGLEYNIEDERKELINLGKKVTLGNMIEEWETFTNSLEEGKLYVNGEGLNYKGPYAKTGFYLPSYIPDLNDSISAYGKNNGYFYSLGSHFGKINKEKSIEYFQTAVKTFEFLQ